MTLRESLNATEFVQAATNCIRRDKCLTPDKRDLALKIAPLHLNELLRIKANQPLAGAVERTRTSTILLTATSRQRVYQFRHDRIGSAPKT
jgi:hypothetical protein